MKRRISLVTGGLGFVGSNLVDLLVDLGDLVYVIDNLSSESSSKDYVNPHAIYFYEDVKNINKFLQGYQFDRIFHLAAEARIQPSFETPLKYFDSNIMGTAEICEFARISKSKCLVYATTSSKNHGTAYLTPYTFSKVAGEGLIQTYTNCFNLNAATATFYNVYGPREPHKGEWATVVAKFLRQFNSGKQLTVVGDGTQTRDFTHVEDICKGLVKISEGTWKGDNFDLGRGQPISILDLALMICEDDFFRIDHVPLRKNEGLHTMSNHEETFKKLCWTAEKSISDYINCLKTKTI
jgi:UDP-glucose 4-epimerase